MVGPYMRMGSDVLSPELPVESVVVVVAVAGGIVDLLIEGRVVCGKGL